MENNDIKTTETTETTEEIFSEYELTPEEMITVKGGEDIEKFITPNPPRIKIWLYQKTLSGWKVHNYKTHRITRWKLYPVC